MSTLQISRYKGYVDRLRDYTVICDGEPLGKIANGESKTFEVEPSTNGQEKEIYLKIDWCRSNRLNVLVPPDGSVCLEGGSNLVDLNVLWALYYVVFKPNEYLRLSHKDTESDT